MRFVFSVLLIVLAGLVSPVAASSSPGLLEDSEGSGIDLESSGSGDWSDLGNSKHTGDPTVVVSLSCSHTMDPEEEKPPADIQKATNIPTSGFVFLDNGRHYLEKEEVLAGMIAGVLMGAAIGAAIAGILIHKWKKREDEGGLLGKRDFT